VYFKEKGYKEDKYEFFLINNKRKLMTNESYVLTSQDFIYINNDN